MVDYYLNNDNLYRVNKDNTVSYFNIYNDYIGWVTSIYDNGEKINHEELKKELITKATRLTEGKKR
jgi:hypothetical protein